MSQMENGTAPEGQRIREMLETLDARMARLETYLGFPPYQRRVPDALTRAAAPAAPEAESGFEWKVGQFGLAWIGSTIFLLGVLFLIVYAANLGYGLVAGILGYSAAAGFYFLSRTWRDTFSHLSGILFASSLVLLFFTTLRLHFFSPQPLIEKAWVALVLLLLAVAIQFYLALRRDSQAVAVLALVLGFAAALVVDRTHLTLPLNAALSGLAVYLNLRRRWWVVTVMAVVLANGSHLIWLLNNPLMGHPMQAVAGHQYNLVYLFLYALLFAWPTFFFTAESSYETPSIALVGLNCLGFSFVVGMVAYALFRTQAAAVSFAAAGLFLAVSVIQWRSTRQNFAPAIYAGFGLLALSIAFYIYAGAPAAFLYLALESLLVVSLALWFRSRILVVANSCIFAAILLVYLFSGRTIDTANFSFAIVAILTARVMNWQKERLTLRTELLRNVYLIIAFLLVLFALRHASPPQFVTLSWAAAAALYFLLSLLLKNIKYRWMAMGTMLAAVLYLFAIDLARLDASYRVVAFLFVGLIAVVISLFYTKFRRFLGQGGDDRESP